MHSAIYNDAPGHSAYACRFRRICKSDQGESPRRAITSGDRIVNAFSALGGTLLCPKRKCDRDPYPRALRRGLLLIRK